MPEQPRKLDDWIEGYLKYTQSSESPRIFREWVAVSSVAAALERKTWLNLGLETFFPNLYIILVGPSGTRKGTSMKPAKDIMDKVGLNLSTQSTTKEALAEQLADAHKIEDMTSVNDQMYPHSSITVYNEEIAVLFKHNDPDMIMWLTDWHDCHKQWQRDTKTQGDTYIDGVWVNLLGAMTPELVKAYLPETAIGGGLTGRIIFAYSGKKGQINALPFLSEEEAAMEPKLVHDLEAIHALRGEFGYTENFLETWTTWVHEEESKDLFNEKNLDPYVNRRRAHALKLCMILSASENNELVITERLLERADDFLSRVERSMPKVFSGVGSGHNARILSEIAEYLGEQERLTKQEILERFYKDVDDKKHLDSVLGTLEGMSYVSKKVDGQDIIYETKDGESLEKQVNNNGKAKGS